MVQDSYGAQRKEKMQNTMSLYRCHTIFNVSLAVCGSGIYADVCSAPRPALRASTRLWLFRR